MIWTSTWTHIRLARPWSQQPNTSSEAMESLQASIVMEMATQQALHDMKLRSMGSDATRRLLLKAYPELAPERTPMILTAPAMRDSMSLVPARLCPGRNSHKSSRSQKCFYAEFEKFKVQSSLYDYERSESSMGRLVRSDFVSDMDRRAKRVNSIRG